MKIPYYHVDAFARQPFTGNPAGVCLLEEWLSDEVMLKIAFENNLSETAFLVHESEGCRIRWFTPAAEVDLCGHATLASAHVLFQHQGWKQTQVKFASRSGDLRVERQGEILNLDFPARPAQPCPPIPELIEALNCNPVEILCARDYLVVLENPEEVQALEPDFYQLAGLERFGTIVTAPGHEVDFVTRFFAPALGIPEDPVTGSAQCTLIPYWSKRLSKSTLKARQLSRRGGELFCEDFGDRVRIGGYAVTYSIGEITL